MEYQGLTQRVQEGADLATPQVRPFQFMPGEAGRLYFCTSNQKRVFREMQKHPCVEFCASGENFSWLRLSGQVVFSKDLGLKAKDPRGQPHRQVDLAGSG